jgi:hypothetical protein
MCFRRRGRVTYLAVTPIPTLKATVAIADNGILLTVISGCSTRLHWLIKDANVHLCAHWFQVAAAALLEACTWCGSVAPRPGVMRDGLLLAGERTVRIFTMAAAPHWQSKGKHRAVPQAQALKSGALSHRYGVFADTSLIVESRDLDQPHALAAMIAQQIYWTPTRLVLYSHAMKRAGVR